MSTHYVTRSHNLETNAILQSPSPSLKVHGILKKEELRLAEKTNSFASPLLISIGAALLAGCLFSFNAAIVTGFVLYFVILWLSRSTYPRNNNRPYLPWQPTAPFHHHPSSTSNSHWSGFPPHSHATIGGGRPSAPRNSYPQSFGYSPSSTTPDSNSRVGIRRSSASSNPYPQSFGYSSSSTTPDSNSRVGIRRSSAPSNAYTPPRSEGPNNSHAFVGIHRTKHN